jgi:hypothetical protein
MKSVFIRTFALFMVSLFSLNLKASETLEQDRVKFSEILATGVTQADAEELCQRGGTRLPTIKELALLAQKYGAEGVREIDGALKNMNASSDQIRDMNVYMMNFGFEPIFGLGDNYPENLENRRVVAFYYRKYGYTAPTNLRGILWSSSLHPGEENQDDGDAGERAYLFDSASGEIYADFRTESGYWNDQYAVRCIQTL